MYALSCLDSSFSYGAQHNTHHTAPTLFPSGTVAFDSLLTEYDEDPKRQISRIGHALGVCAAAATNSHILATLEELSATLAEDKMAGAAV